MSQLTPTKTMLTNVSVQRLIPYEKNPRNNDAAIRGVMQSLNTYGYIKTSIVVDENMVLLCGHTTLKAIKRIGWDAVPEVIQVTGLDEMSKRGYRIADNKTGEVSQWDIDLLLSELQDLKLDGFDVTLTGFSQRETELLMGGIDDLAVGSGYEIPPPPPKPRIVSSVPDAQTTDCSDNREISSVNEPSKPQLGGSCNSFMPAPSSYGQEDRRLGGMPVVIHKPLDVSLHFNNDAERNVWDDYLDHLKDEFPELPSIAAKIIADIQNRNLW